MVRSTVSLAFAGILLMGCGVSQPMHMSLEDNWTPQQQEHIRNDMHRWEKATNHLVTFIVSDTPFHDITGGFEVSDLADGVNVLYKLVKPNPTTDWLIDTSDEDLIGYGLNTDVLIYWYKLGLSDSPYQDLYYLDPLILHEIGHHFGMGHIRNHPAIMDDLSWIDCITQWDLESFCSIYGCDLKDMHPECITAP